MSATRPLAWDEFSSDGEEIVYLDSVFGSPAVLSDNDDGDYILIPHQRSPTLVVPPPRPIDVEAELSNALSALSLAPANQQKPKPKPKATTPKAGTKAGKAKDAPRSPATPKGKKRPGSSGGKPQPKSAASTCNSKPATNLGSPAPPSSAYPSPPASPAPPSRRARKRAAAKAAKLSTGLGERTVVDDVSEAGTDAVSHEEYSAARSYIASHLANPPANISNGSLLPLLQALIVELGLSEQTPRSLTAAKGILKSRAFIGVREYLAAREDGPDALRRAMHPSKNALVRALRKGSIQRAPRDWVKSTGLSVLLVQAW